MNLTLTRDPIKLIVDGQEVLLNVDDDVAINDLSKDMETVPGQIAWYYRVLAAAEEHHDRLNAKYRNWRGEQAQYILSDDPRRAEWKVKADVDALPEFLTFKEKLAEVGRLITTIKGATSGLLRKADMLRSIGARERDEIHTTDVGTRSRRD